MKLAMRRLTLVLYVVPVLLAVNGDEVSSVRGEPPRFLTVAPGIEHATFRFSQGDAESFSGRAFKIDLDVAELRLVPAGGPSSRRTVEEIVASHLLSSPSMQAFLTKTAGRWALLSMEDDS
jgi:hypothetical protein